MSSGNIWIECEECNTGLDCVGYTHGILVKPCEKCMKEKIKEALEEQE